MTGPFLLTAAHSRTGLKGVTGSGTGTFLYGQALLNQKKRRESLKMTIA